MALSRGSDSLDIELEQVTPNGAVFIHNSKPGTHRSHGKEFEKMYVANSPAPWPRPMPPGPRLRCLSRPNCGSVGHNSIDEQYLDKPGPEGYRVETYRSRGTVASGSHVQLRCYFVGKCEFVNPDPAPGERDIRQVSDRVFLERATPGTLELYQRVMNNALDRTGVVIELIDYPETEEKRLIIGFRRGTTQNYFSALSDLYHYYDLYSSRKYVETFSNGIAIYSIYLKQAGNNPKAPSIESSILQVTKEASLLYCLPSTPFRPLFQQSKLSVQETTYAYVTYIFCQHFLNRLGSEYLALQAILTPKDTAHEAVLNQIKKRLRDDTFTRENILDILMQRPELIQLCYKSFAMTHHINVAPIQRPGQKPGLLK